MNQIQALETSKLIPLRPSHPLVSRGYASLLTDWLGQFSSLHTVRVYRHAIREFLSCLSSGDELEVLTQFFLLEQELAVELVYQYKGELIKEKLAPATINRKLASIKSLVNYAAGIGKCFYTLSEIKTTTVMNYRDTTGISSDSFKLMLDCVDQDTLSGKRDYGILLLLWGNALRRSEVRECKIRDFEPTEQKLWILGKGKKGQSQSISLGRDTRDALVRWLSARGEREGNAPLFCAVHKGYWGHQLNTDSIYKIVKKYGQLAGIQKPLSPHRLRHSAITAALEITNGDVRSVQKLSRHSNLNTLMIYDDNRRNEQGRVTNLLESIL